MSEGQHGIVTRSQLRAIGIGNAAIDYRVGTGRLHPVHRGVYAVGDRTLPHLGREHAAVLATGPGSALSHRSAAALHGLRRWDGTPEITSSRRQRPKPGIVLHTSRLPRDEIVTVGEVPVTTVTRTLLDMARWLEGPALRRLIDEARVQRMRLRPSFATLLERHPFNNGIVTLREVLAELDRSPGATRSEYEAEFLAFIAELGLPAPAVNQRIRIAGETFMVDLWWPDARLVVELDGAAFHSHATAVERDKRRDRRLQAVGIRVVRVTWRQFKQRQAEVAEDLRAAMAIDLRHRPR